MCCSTYTDSELETMEKKLLKNSITYMYKLKLFIPANILVIVIMKLYTWGTNLGISSMKLQPSFKSSFSNHDPHKHPLAY